MTIMVELNETTIIESMVEYEGYTLEEAKLTYKTRQRLPSSAFCGPSRTYPSHDARRVRNGLARLSQFGGKLKPAVRKSIFNCLSRRAKRMGIEISDDVRKKYRKVGESEEGKETKEDRSTDREKILKWYMEEVYPNLKKKEEGDK